MENRKLIRILQSSVAYMIAELRTALIYKANFYFQIIGFASILIIQVYLWKQLDSANLPYTDAESVTLYVVITQSLFLLLSGNVTIRFLSERVRKGTIAIDLLRPMDLMLIAFSHQVGRTISMVVFVILPNIVFVYMILGVNFLQGSLTDGMLFVVSLCLSYLISFQIGFLVGVVSIWIGNIWGFKEFIDAFAIIMGGTLIPIYFYPEWLQTLAKFFPFQSIFYTPASYLTDLPPLIHNSLLFQVIWVCVFLIFNRWLLRKSLENALIQGG